MSEEPYSNREIDSHFQEIKEFLIRIEEQTKKTNGRVTASEQDIVELKTGHKIANWAFGITLPLILSMGVWIFFNQVQSIEKTLETHIHADAIKWTVVWETLGIPSQE